MYSGFFGLKKQPFASVPQTDQYFPGATIESARVGLARCIERGEGVAMVVGPTGTGKSLLCRLLAEQFRASFPVAELSCGRLSTRRSLFQAILYKLGQSYREMDEGELRIALADYLTLGKAPHRGMVLIVDEAHTLPLRLLDEIRMLTNLAGQGRPLVRLLLAGNASLEERFAGPKMESFSQRISTRCYLESLGRSETLSYIHAQIDLAGGCGADLFSEEGCESVFKATDGVPRLINQLCDHALLTAYVAGLRTIGPAQIEEAWADLQQLPTPWNGEGRSEKCGVIEFGRIEDSADESDKPAAEQSVEFPSLRVANDFDEVEAELTEVCQQIESLESTPARPEEDFQPVGSAQPEIELDFGQSDHPFKEEFEQEEVIADRYGAAGGTSPVVPQPAVSPAAWAQAAGSTSSAEMGRFEQTATAQGQGDLHAAECAALRAGPSGGKDESSGVKSDAAIPCDKRSRATSPRGQKYSRLFVKLLQGNVP